VVPAPSGLTATGVLNGIQLDWTNPPSRLFDFIDVYEATNSASWGNASLVASIKGNTITFVRDPGNEYYYWVRARVGASDVSTRNPDSDTSTVTAAPVTEFFAAPLSSDPFFKSSTSWDETGDTVRTSHQSSGGFEGGPYWDYESTGSIGSAGIQVAYSSVTDLPQVRDGDKVVVRIRWRSTS